MPMFDFAQYQCFTGSKNTFEIRDCREQQSFVCGRLGKTLLLKYEINVRYIEKCKDKIMSQIKILTSNVDLLAGYE